jgi:tRNA-dihydrouridine synthase B
VKISRIHLEKSVKWKSERVAVNEMRKHYGDYFKGYPNFKNFKMALMEASSEEMVNRLLDEIESFYSDLI